MINDQKIILNKLSDKLQCSSLNNVSLSEDSGEVAFHISGYIAKKNSKRFGKCLKLYNKNWLLL